MKISLPYPSRCILKACWQSKLDTTSVTMSVRLFAGNKATPKITNYSSNFTLRIFLLKFCQLSNLSSQADKNRNSTRSPAHIYVSGHRLFSARYELRRKKQLKFKHLVLHETVTGNTISPHSRDKFMQ